MPFSRCVSGTRVVPRGGAKTVCGIHFDGFGSSANGYPHSYLTAACAIGLGQDEVEKLRIDIAKLDSEYKVKAQALEKASERREAEEKAKLFKTIQDAVKKVADKNGYDLVIDISALQYGKPEYNISEDVIKALK